MSLTTASGWTSPSGAQLQEINSNGVWELTVGDGFFRPDDPVRIRIDSGSSGDPAGATVQVGMKTGILTPEDIDGAALTLPSLASTSASIPVRVYPDGRLCLTVTDYVNPFVATVIQ